MLFGLGRVSEGDYGEESLVSRFLLAMVFNEHAQVNQGARAFRTFARRCLDIEVSGDVMSKATATVEFQADRSGTGGDKTTFDSLLTIEPDWVWGIEAKYFDVLKREQIEREAEAIGRLAEKLAYKRAGLLFLTPEQQLGTVVSENHEVHACLANLMRDGAIAVRLGTWETVTEILGEAGTGDLRQQLAAFWEVRNKNTTYVARVASEARVKTCDEWERYVLGELPIPADLPKLSDSGVSNFSRFGQASAELADVFGDGHLALARAIVERAGRFRFEHKSQRSKYVNLSRKGRAHAQLHPHPGGVVIVVREAAGELRHSANLSGVPCRSLPGYRGSNRSWLDGDGKNHTFTPAAGLLVPACLGEDREQAVWQELDGVLSFALTK